MTKLLLFTLFLITTSPSLFSDDTEIRLQKLESDVEVMKQHLKTKKITVSGEAITDYGFYHDRGDITAYDFLVSSFTSQEPHSSWYDMDLSSIVPEGAKTVLLTAIVDCEDTEQTLRFRENGNTDVVNTAGISIQAVGIIIRNDLVVSLDSDRKIEFALSNSTWTTINVAVRGWFK